jgi:hypothetical protein
LSEAGEVGKQETASNPAKVMSDEVPHPAIF